MEATAGLAPSRKLSERLFGYDVFISFALGEPPRGNYSYASDLARRLQDAGLVVFFCDHARDFSNIAVSADRFFWVGYEQGNSDEASAIVRRWPDCEALGNWEDMLSEGLVHASLQTLVPLPNQRLLVGWLDGRLQVFTGNEQSALLPVKPRPLAAVWADNEGNRIAVLDHAKVLRLFNLEGKELGSPLQLVIGKPTHTSSKAWLDFSGHLAVDGKPKVVKAQVQAKTGVETLVLVVVPEQRGVTFLLQGFETDKNPLLDAVAVSDELSGCSYAYYLTAMKLARYALQDGCSREGEERHVEVDYPRSNTGYVAGAFCQEGTFVLGDWEGNVYWMRTVKSLFVDLGVEREHIEHSWPDAVSSVACNGVGETYVSFRNNGVKRFNSPWRLETREIERDPGIIPVSGRPEEDVAWDVATFHGPATLYLRAAQGDLELFSREELVWRKNFARPRGDETGNQTDFVQSVAMDVDRNRFWVLTSFGRLFLVELYTGSILARFGTGFYSAERAIPSGLDKLVVSAEGGISFSYERDGKFLEVAVTPRSE
ncbi:hypothetical protein D3C76_470000 [compost metagenome]